jgi:hypothetical protein
MTLGFRAACPPQPTRRPLSSISNVKSQIPVPRPPPSRKLYRTPLSPPIVGWIWRETRTYKPIVRHYKDEKTGEVIAEVVSSDDPSFEFAVVVENPGKADAEKRLYLRKKGGPTVE